MGMIINVTQEYQEALFRLCAVSITRMREAAPLNGAELRDTALRSMLRSSARRLFEAPVFTRGLARDVDVGASPAAGDSSVFVLPGSAEAPHAEQEDGEALDERAAINWSEVGYDPRYRGIERLSQQDELRFVVLAKAGDVFARQKLTVHYLPLLRSIARRYRHRGLCPSELVNEGIFGLVRAIDRFEPSRHLRFGTYAKWWMRDAMEQALATQGRLVRLPVHVMRAMRKQARERQGENGGRTAALPARRENAHGENPDAALLLCVDDPDGELGVDEATPETLVDEKQQHGKLVQALSALTEREREVVIGRFGLNDNEPRTLMTMAEEMNLSHERVRQIQNGALTKLRMLLGSQGEAGLELQHGEASGGAGDG